MCGEIEWLMWQLKPEAKEISWGSIVVVVGILGLNLLFRKIGGIVKDLTDRGIIQEVSG